MSINSIGNNNFINQNSPAISANSANHQIKNELNNLINLEILNNEKDKTQEIEPSSNDNQINANHNRKNDQEKKDKKRKIKNKEEKENEHLLDIKI